MSLVRKGQFDDSFDALAYSTPDGDEIRYPRTVLLALLALSITLFALKHSPAPYVVIAIIWAAFVLSLMRLRKGDKPRLFCMSLSAALLTLGSYEAYLQYKSSLGASSKPSAGQAAYTHPKGYFVRHPILGTVPAKGFTAQVQRYFANRLLYSVTYTIGSNGLRVSPPFTQNGKCVLFFGDSFTFGEGVNDYETMPYLVGSLSHGMYQTNNFGFHGYGPNHMLATLQYRLEADAISCAPTHVVYTAIPGHINRAAGLVPFSRHCPRYILDSQGNPIHAGSFSDFETQSRSSTVLSVLLPQLEKSLLLQRTILGFRRVIPEDIRLFVAMIDESRQILHRRYPQTHFSVIFWDNSNFVKGLIDPRYVSLAYGSLIERGIDVHLITKILPDPDNVARWAIAQEDWHPNANAHKLIAHYVISNILSK